MAIAANTDVIDVGDTSTASGSDFPLVPGATLVLPTEDAIWADSASGTQVLAYVEVYD